MQRICSNINNRSVEEDEGGGEGPFKKGLSLSQRLLEKLAVDTKKGEELGSKMKTVGVGSGLTQGDGRPLPCTVQW